MAVTSFIEQPVASSLHAAYRPMVFRAVADGATPPPRVYCDIYFGGIYYRTISKTAVATQNASNSEWVFDIQDATQEYLSHYLAANGGDDVVEAAPPLVRVQCKFRTSTYNAGGFIVQETPIPIQATSSTAATAGGGFASNTFYVLNASLKHSDNQSLAAHLASFKKGTWGATNYPATHRPNQKIGIADSDYFPALISDELCNAKLVLHYRLAGETVFDTEEVLLPSICSASIGSITVSQITATTNANVSWTFTGSPTGFEYRLDGGAWLTAAVPSATLSTLSVGAHTIEVRGVCGCAYSATALQAFDIVASGSACSSIVTITAITQNGSGSASVDFTSTGPATSWEYAVDGGAYTSVPSNPFNVTGLANGLHNIAVRPVCAGGAIGTSDSDSIDITDYTPVYWYRVRFGDDPCGSALVRVYSTSAVFGSGIDLFTNSLLTTPLAGPPTSYVAAYMGSGTIPMIGEIFELLTYQVGDTTGSGC